MKWSKQAEEAIAKIPFFVRGRVKRRVEEEAKRSGNNEVTLELVHQLKRRFLHNMDDEVKGYQLENCFGSTGCPYRLMNTDKLKDKLEKFISKRKLRSFLKERVQGALKIHHEFRISISDCPNSCSRPQIADIGLIAVSKPKVTDKGCNLCKLCQDACEEDALSFINDEKPFIDFDKCLNCASCIKVCPTGTISASENGYKIIIGGKLGRHPQLAKEIPGIYSMEKTIKIVETILDFYMENNIKGERLGDIVNRVGMDVLINKIEAKIKK
ncbi:MAG: sulfite reductase [Deltaproteobacteria bacterium]|nr:MAG: sulfite reductase [Deltaproteobacteria bacterium]